MLNVSSRISDATWPAISNSRASQLLAVQFQLERSQWLPPDRLRSFQWQQLRRVLHHAYHHVPFYRSRREAIGYPPPSNCTDEVGWASDVSYEDWLKLPLPTLDDFQAAGAQLYSTPMRADHCVISQSTTTGSTATSVVTLGTTVTRMMWSACALRQHLWAKRDFSGKLCSIRALSGDAVTDNWGLGTLDIVRTGPAAASLKKTRSSSASFLVSFSISPYG